MEKTYQDEETLDEMYERLRIESLPPSQQELVLRHHLDQFNAVPSYVAQQAQEFATRVE